MHILNLVEEWAKRKGWAYTHLVTPPDDGYLYLAIRHPWEWEIRGEFSVPIQKRSVFVLWANCAWGENGEYPGDIYPDGYRSGHLNPADPNFFTELERLVIEVSETRTKEKQCS